MKRKLRAAATLAFGAIATTCIAQDYTTRIVASGLNEPTGIAVQTPGSPNIIYFTEVPTPGVPGSMGGQNRVAVINIASGRIQTLSAGEPEPINLSLSQGGVLYWTCKSAGVILRRLNNGMIQPVLTDLDEPSGISVGAAGIYFTQLPTPGVAGGKNTVNLFDGMTIHTLTMGEPEPTDIVVDRFGNAYWTCKSAGVILRRTSDGNVSVFLDMLNDPVGIDIDFTGRWLYFTEVPTPGVPGGMGGQNRVWKADTQTGQRTLVHFGDPEPTDVAVAIDGRVFWTCTSAGVIVEARPTKS